jgi:hypothetical protein
MTHAGSREGVAVREPGADAAARRTAHWPLVATLFASIFLQRFGMSAGGGEIAFNLLVTVAALAVLALRGALVVDPMRVTLFCVLAACASFSALLNADMASTPSLGLLLILYAPFALSLREPGDAFRTCLVAFRTMVLILAVFGIAQFLGQFVVGTRYLFSFKELVSGDLLLERYYHVENPLYWNSPILKGNGFFLLEPSGFSQYLALGIIFELLYFGVTYRIPIYVAALLFSYSGTGFILLVLMLPLILVRRRAYGAVAGLGAIGVLAVILGDLWRMDVLLQRVGEFGQVGSSAHARFFSWISFSSEHILTHARDLVFGLGPGAFAKYAQLQRQETFDISGAKLLFEYGLLGVGAFLLLFATAVFHRSPSRWISAALAIGFVTFGGMLLDTRLHALLLVFCVLPKPPFAVRKRPWTSVRQPVRMAVRP